jgi:hypothetical protein
LRPGGINLTFLNSAIYFGKIRKITTGILLKRDWVSPTADLEVAEKKISSCLCSFLYFSATSSFYCSKKNNFAASNLRSSSR